MQEIFHQWPLKKIFLPKNEVFRECVCFTCVHVQWRPLQTILPVSCSWPRKALVAKKRAKSFFFPIPSKPLSDTIQYSPLVDVLCLFYCVYEVDEVMGEYADGGILKSLLLNRPPSNFSLSTFKVRWIWISVLKHWGAASIETEISLSRPCAVFRWAAPRARPPVHTQRDKKVEKEKIKKGNTVNDEREGRGEQSGWWNGSEGVEHV